MQKSKVESYEGILQVLISKPLTIDHIAYELNMDCTILSHHLRFLVKNHLIEERRLDKKRGYAITERGIMVLKTLNYSKYLEKHHAKLPVIDEAREILRELKKSGLKGER